MGALRSLLAKTVRRVLARRGLVLVRPERRLGFDPWADILRLAGAWRYSIATFFDVGANDGETAAAALRRFPGAQIVGFEPHPVTFSALMTRMGGEARFRGVNSALGTETGDVAMFEYDSSKVNSLTADVPFAVRFGEEGRRIAVRCTTLDSYCAQNGIERIDVLKIDAEGFDLMVLQGGRAMLQKRAIGFIYVEFNDLQPKEGAFGGALLPIDAFLRPYGYRFVASYIDYIVARGEMFSVSNALFALPPRPASGREPFPADGILR